MGPRNLRDIIHPSVRVGSVQNNLKSGIARLSYLSNQMKSRPTPSSVSAKATESNEVRGSGCKGDGTGVAVGGFPD